MREEMLLRKIGIIYSEYTSGENAPRQGKYSDKESIVEIFEEYMSALDGLKVGKSILVAYWGDRADRTVLKTIPPFMTEELGVFATRSPNRPNPIALCICEIISIDKNKLRVKDLDAFNESPLLDIKVHNVRIDY